VGKIPILSEKWNELWLTEAAGLREREPGVTATIEITLRRDDDSTLAFTFYYIDGLLDAVRAADPDADVRMEMPEDVWQAYSAGERGAMSRATLTGSMRMVGDPDKNDVIRQLTRNDVARGIRARVHAQTKYRRFYWAVSAS
jgi:hypothetical protein